MFRIVTKNVAVILVIVGFLIILESSCTNAQLANKTTTVQKTNKKQVNVYTFIKKMHLGPKTTLQKKGKLKISFKLQNIINFLFPQT